MPNKRFIMWWVLRYFFRNNPTLVVVMFVTHLLQALIPAAYIVVINYIAIATQSDSVVLPILSAIGLFAASIHLYDLNRYLVGLFAKKVLADATKEYLDLLSNLSPRSYNDHEFMQQLRTARSALQDGALNNLFEALRQIMMALVSTLSIAATLSTIDSKVALVALLLPVPLVVNFVLREKFVSKSWPEIVEAYRQSHYFKDQMAFQRTGFELASLNGAKFFADKAMEYKNQQVDLFIKTQLKSAAVEFCSNLLIIALFAYSVYLLIHSTTLALLVGAISGLTNFLHVVMVLGDHFNTIANQSTPCASLRHLFETAQLKEPAQEVALEHKLTATDVVVNYGDHQALKKVSLELTPGGFTALVGLNGAGKTTFMKALMGGQVSASGSITADAVTFSVNDEQYRLGFSCVQQDYGRYELTLRQYLSLGIGYQATDAQLQEALAKVGLTELVASLPQGLDTQLGEQWEQGVNVSGGQWQRFAIARSFLGKTSLLYLDEPTSAVDASAEEFIFKEIAAIAQQRLVLVTTHRLSTLRHAQRIYVLRDGEVVEVGTFTELNRQGSYFYELFQAQLSTKEASCSSY